jgi:DNA repair photolyase
MDDINLTNNTPRDVDRVYQDAATVCLFGCEYCFSKWSSKICKTVDVHEKNKITVFYPLCDSELGTQNMNDFEILIQNYIKDNSNRKKLIISISTKDEEFDTHIPTLSKIHEAVSVTGGFVRLGVSFTNISYASLEQGTASFEKRITLLEKLSKYDFKLSAVIKPVLPFVGFDEYKKIVEKTSIYVNKYLIGGLYVEEGSPFYKKYIIKGKYNTTPRTVAWLNNATHLYVGSDEMQEKISRFIASIGNNAYFSDIEMIESWI